MKDNCSTKRFALVFAASPVIAVQLIGAAYFQAREATVLLLTLVNGKQGFLILVLILPEFFFGIFECGGLSIADVEQHQRVIS
jgi:hypothetical protein